MKVALVHDWLTGMRGGEKVLLSLARLFPDAPIYTLLHVPGSVAPELEAREIHTSFVQHLPAVSRRYRHYLPLFPSAIESLDLSGLRPGDLQLPLRRQGRDRAAGRPPRLLLPHADALRLGPLRRLLRPGPLPAPLRWAMGPIAAWLRRWDARTAARVHRFVANSAYVAERIRRYYGREAEVIHPPVDTDFFTPGDERPGAYDLVVSALAPYKRLELVLEAYRGTGRPLQIVGSGPERAPPRARRPARGRASSARSSTSACASSTGAAGPCSCRESRTSASCRSRPWPAAGRPSSSAKAAAWRRWSPGETGLVFHEPTAAALRAAVDSLQSAAF